MEKEIPSKQQKKNPSFRPQKSVIENHTRLKETGMPVKAVLQKSAL
jgi:hypothetical protein